MKNITKFTISFSIFLILITPAVSLGAWTLGESLVPCGRKTITTTDPQTKVTTTTVDPKDLCGFDDIIKLINSVIDFIIFYMAIPIAAIMFAYAGVLLVTSGGEPGARTKAKGIFFNTVIGLVIAVAAYIIVKTILSIVGYTDINMFF